MEENCNEKQINEITKSIEREKRNETRESNCEQKREEKSMRSKINLRKRKKSME